MRKVALVALTDGNRLVAVKPYIAAPVITTSTLAAGSSKTFAGTCAKGAEITILKNGEPLVVNGVVQKATVTATNWTYTIATAAADETYSVRATGENLAAKDAAAGVKVGA